MGVMKMTHEDALRSVKNLIDAAYKETNNNEIDALVILMMASRIVQETFNRIDGYPAKVTEIEAHVEEYARILLDCGESMLGTVNDYMEKHKEDPE